MFNENLEVAPALAFSPDSNFLIYVVGDKNGEGEINFYSIESRSVKKQIDLDLSRSNVSAISFSPDGNILALGFTDGVIELFDAQNGSEIYNWNAHNGHIKSLEFSPNGQMLLSVGSIDQYAKIWGELP